MNRRGIFFSCSILSLFCLTAVEATAWEFYGPPEPKRDFKEDCIFLGIAKKGEVVAVLHFRREEWTPRGLLIRAVLVATEYFPFESGYRGFQKKEHCRIKKGKSLRLTSDGAIFTFSLKNNVDIGDTSSLAVEFLARNKRKELIPDKIDTMDFEVKDVLRWDKVKSREISRWRRSFEKMNAALRGGKGGRAGIGDRPGPTLPQIDKDEYRGRYVTLNGTYVFENKTVYSPIIAVLDLGSYVEHTKHAGGNWMEVLYGDSGIKGYILSVFLVDDQEEALRWEREMNLQPLEPPLGPVTPEEGESDEIVDQP